MRKLQWLVLAFFFFFFGCTKIETTNIGSGLIPPIDGVTTLETSFDVVTNNYIDNFHDSLKAYKSDDHVIGVIKNDPVFGKTTAVTYCELKPTTFKFGFPGGTSLIADSAVLILSYKGVYGDTTTNQNWEVRELSETLRGDTTYTVNKSFSANNLLGSKTIDITELNDSINYGRENAVNQIRIKLSSSFASRLIKQYDSSNAYKSDELFKENFKGFAIAPASGSGGNALIRVNLLDTNTKLALFYKFKASETAAAQDTAVSYFRMSLDTTEGGVHISGSANYIKREYNGSQLTQFTNNNATTNDSLVFIQTAPGTFATVKIPGLSEFPNAIIHRAELVAIEAPGDPNLEQYLTPPQVLLLSIYDSVNKVKRNVPNDFIIGTSGDVNFSTFGGYIMQRDIPGAGIVRAYTFDLTRYVQGIVTRKDSSYTLTLSAPSNDSLMYTNPYPGNTSSTPFYLQPSIANNIADGRVRLGGGMHASNPIRMRFRIIYSKI